MGNRNILYTTKTFVEQASIIHNNFYRYDTTVYGKNNQDKVKIICPRHGEFLQVAKVHLKGHGCNKCAIEQNYLIRVKNIQLFINEATELHSNLYNYDKVVYKNNSTKVNILCNTCHEYFLQAPDKHLQGRGCPKCNVSGWGYTEWLESSKRSIVFDSFKVYIIKCWGNSEEFYKIGKTYRTIHSRFISPKLPYNYSVILCIEDDGLSICKYEKLLHNHHKEFKYKPKINFMGRTECYSQIDYLFAVMGKGTGTQSITGIVVDNIKKLINGYNTL